MTTAWVVVALAAVLANGFSGVTALVHFEPIAAGMAAVGVPPSWMTFPIGTLKTLGAVGLLVGLLALPALAIASAAGLVLFFVCAVYTHLLAGDRSPQFALALGFLALNAATLTLGILAA